MINGETQVLGLIGNPVAHTLSPVIHNTIARQMGMNLAYLPFPVKEDVFSAVRGAYALGIWGMNVTVPYKREVLSALCEVDREAHLIGAVNTLVRCEEGFKGYNTDMPGLYRALKNEGISIKDRKVILVGAGGAARAAAYMCALKGAEAFYILNRTKEKAGALADEITQKTGYQKVYPLGMEEYGKIPGRGYLVLQATKVGLYPNVEESPIEDKEFFQKAEVVYDLIYNPQKTRFMKLAEEQGARVYHGLTMLLYQGVHAFELWYQMQVPQNVIDAVYEELKKECNIHE